MIKKITLLSVLLLIITSFFFLQQYAMSWGHGGQGKGYSSSPGDNLNNCGSGGYSCHNVSATTVTWVTTNIPTTGYVGGTSYSITIKPTTDSYKGWGFEITCEKPDKTKVGKFTTATGTKTFNSGLSLTSTGYTTTAGKVLTWTAPATGTGSITFYCSLSSWRSNSRKCSVVVAEACTPPTLSLSPTSPSTCSGSPVTLTASGNSTSYSWSNSSTGSSITVSPTTNTTYTVTGTLSGCTSTSSVSVTVTPKPTTPTINQGTGGSILLTSSVSTGNQWYNSSTGIINGATNQTYTPTVNGTYYTKVTANGCISDQSNSITITTVGISENENKNNAVWFYPNPVIDYLSVMTTNAAEMKISILNMQGQVIFNQFTKKELTKINISSLPKGFYFLKTEGEEGSSIHKFVKE